MATPSLAMIPSGYKDGKVYSVLPANGDGDFTFSRGSNATRVNKDGLIETITDQDLPRLDYSDGSCPSLKLEPQSTNYVEYSEDFNNSYWSKTNASVLGGFISPDGTNNSNKIDFSCTSSNARIHRTSISASNQSFSFFFKYNSLEQIMIYIRGIDKGSYLDVKNAVFLGGNAVGGGIDASNVSIKNYGNGWYRFVYEHDSANIGGLEIYASSNSSFNSITVTGSIYIWGVQLEQQSHSTSYIPTNGAISTRLQDECNSAGTSDTFNDSKGVLYAEIAALVDDSTGRYYSLSDGTSSNRVRIGYSSTDNTIRALVVSQGNIAFDYTHTTSDIKLFSKIAFSYKQDDFSFWIDGVKVHSDTSGNTPTALSRLSFDDGKISGTGGYFYGNVKDIRVYNTTLTDVELQALTS